MCHLGVGFSGILNGELLWQDVYEETYSINTYLMILTVADAISFCISGIFNLVNCAFRKSVANWAAEGINAEEDAHLCSHIIV